MKISVLKRITALILAAGVVLCIPVGCGKKDKEELPVVKLSVWSDERGNELLDEIIDDFKAEYASQAQFDITVSNESEMTCKETVLENPQAAADIYTFADDQLEELWRAGALLEITDEAADIIAENGGEDSGVCRSAMREGKLVAYPETAGNGYFLYYNSSYFTDEDVKSFDKILEIAAASGKKVAMDFSSGWYIYSFFKGAGLELECNEDGVTNHCNWNATDTDITGEQVAQAMLAVAQHDGFINCTDSLFLSGIEDGSIVAGVNGAWNASYVEDAFGDNYAAVKLPEYTVGGRQVQMCSFAGYKLVGVNAYTQNPQWAMRLARRITNEQNQLRRFEVTGECPSNINAAKSEEIQSSPAVSALAEQSAYGYTQSVADTFWDPASIFGITIAGGNADNRPLQALLDDMVDGITSKGVG